MSTKIRFKLNKNVKIINGYFYFKKFQKKPVKVLVVGFDKIVKYSTDMKNQPLL